MKVRLAYGGGGLEVELPEERTTVVEPAYHEGAADETAVLRAALRAPVAGPPLRELARPGMKVAISMCDGTRAQPRDKMIPAVLDELGVPDSDVVILVATGTHRGNTDEELRAMLGDDIVDRVAVVNHDARDQDSLVFLGEHGRGVPVWINRLWVEADLRITTGFVEPHFFAGFSGGPKLVTPGPGRSRHRARPAQRRPGSAIPGRPGACSRTIRSTRTSAPHVALRRPTLRSTSS